MRYMKRKVIIKIQMINDLIFRIKQDKKLYSYLKYHSYWYEILTLNPEYFKDMIKEMKIELKETVEDKIDKITHNIEMISSLLEVIS